MDKFLSVLRACRLFRGIAEPDIEAVLRCLSAESRGYEKEAPVLRAGDTARKIGIVLSGGVSIIQDDFWGNRTIIGRMEQGEMFAESFSFAGTPIPFTVIAAKASTILFLDQERLITTCRSSCSFHNRLIHNMLGILAGKNILLTRKMEHITRRSTREKLLSYLSDQALKAGTPAFAIPFNRQELADYLSVDRSAMSAELGRLRNEGVLSFRKNEFKLLEEGP